MKSKQIRIAKAPKSIPGSTYEIEVDKDSLLGQCMPTSGSSWAYIDGVKVESLDKMNERKRRELSVKGLTEEIESRKKSLIWLKENKYDREIILAKKEQLAELERKLAIAKRKNEDALNRPMHHFNTRVSVEHEETEAIIVANPKSVLKTVKRSE